MGSIGLFFFFFFFYMSRLLSYQGVPYVDSIYDGYSLSMCYLSTRVA